eukprot:m.41360 g.41360  ORF g.41360 m.41360 type:complete len:430 (-) comp10487_c0_seq1:30-1319(-)
MAGSSQLCRFCLDTGVNLVNPCACSGSQKYVHLTCLRRWQHTVRADEVRARVCNVCQEPFSFAPARESWLRKTYLSVTALFPTFLALIGILAFNHSALFFACLALLAVVSTRTLAIGVLFLAGIFVLLLCLQIRSSQPILFVDERGRTRVALIRRGEPVAGIVAGVLLVATNMIHSGVFHNSVILLLEHGPQGSRGVIINSDMVVSPNSSSSGGFNTASPIRGNSMTSSSAHHNAPGLRYGGPVCDSIILHPFSTVLDSSSVDLTPSGYRLYLGGAAGEIDEHVHESTVPLEWKPIHFKGSAVWSPGQLDGEIRRGAWAWHRGDALLRPLSAIQPPAREEREEREGAQEDGEEQQQQQQEEGEQERLAAVGETAIDGASRVEPSILTTLGLSVGGRGAGLALWRRMNESSELRRLDGEIPSSSVIFPNM